MSNNKLLTLEQLVKFCQDNNFQNFSSNDTGYTLSVQVPGKLDFSEKQSNTLLYTEVKVCHTELNRNGSYISEDNMTKAMPTLKNQPLLASIIEIDEEGTLDFNGHDMKEVENEDGTKSFEYIERQVGCFDATFDPYLKYDDDQKKTYVIAMAAIPRDYSETANIIERKNGTKVSCELIINKMAYNAKEKYLELEDFEFSGVTCLGEHVGEGMLGSRLDIADFSTKNNSVRFEQNNEIAELLKELNDKVDALSSYTKENSKEGGKIVSKFEELLQKYNKTVEDIDFEYSEMSDEELEIKFAELFEEGEGSSDPEPTVEPESDPINDPEPETEPENEPESNPEPENEPNVDPEPADPEPTEENFTKVFSISHEDIKSALYALIAPFEESDNDWYWISAVYDDSFAYEGCFTNAIYGQKYSTDGDNVSLEGERYSLHRELLTDSEYAQLNEMRSNYEVLKQFKEDAEYSKAHAEREAIMSNEKYSIISKKTVKENEEVFENEAYATLYAGMDKYSCEELEEKLKAIVGEYALSGAMQFSAENTVNTIAAKPIAVVNKPAKRSRYGGLGKKEN